MSTGDDLPDGWERDESDEQAGQYNAQRPIRYEHARGVVLNVQPATSDAAATEGDVWRIGIVPEGGRGTVETLREDVEGRDTAIGVASEFMTAYDERCVEGSDTVEDVIASF